MSENKECERKLEMNVVGVWQEVVESKEKRKRWLSEEEKRIIIFYSFGVAVILVLAAILWIPFIQNVGVREEYFIFYIMGCVFYLGYGLLEMREEWVKEDMQKTAKNYELVSLKLSKHLLRGVYWIIALLPFVGSIASVLK